MDIYEMMFLLAFIACIVVAMAKLYNLFQNGRWYTLQTGVLLFIVSLVSFVVAFLTWLNQPAVLLYMGLFSLLKLFMLIQVILFIVEIFFFMRDQAERPAEAYNSYIQRQQQQYMANTRAGSDRVIEGRVKFDRPYR